MFTVRTRRILAASIVGSLAVGIGLFSAHASYNQEGRQEGGMEQGMDQDMAMMMQKMEEAGKPGKYHDFFKPMVGEWEATTEMDMGGEMMTSQGTSTNTMINGGRILKQEFSGDMMGQEFTGVGYSSYDNVGRKFQGIWIDDVSTAIYYSEGAVSEDGKVFTFTGLGSDPMSGQMKPYVHVVRVLSDDEHHFEMSEPGPDGMTKTMTIKYKRTN